MGTVLSTRERALQSRDAIELLTSRWRITILHLLTPGPLRANKIQRAIEGVSPKVLTETLRGLERDGLIARKVRNIVPSHVEYRLTDMGYQVIPLLRNLCQWAKRNAHKRDEARRQFDNASQQIKAAKAAPWCRHESHPERNFFSHTREERHQP